jgi:hypothetical protein
MVNLHIPCLRGICGPDATCEPWLVALPVTVCIPEFWTRAVGCPTVVPMPRSWPEVCIWNKSQHITPWNKFLCERHKITTKLPSAGKLTLLHISQNICLSENWQTSLTTNFSNSDCYFKVLFVLCWHQWNSSQSLYHYIWPLFQGIWTLLHLSWKSQNHFKNTIQYQGTYVATPQLTLSWCGA